MPAVRVGLRLATAPSPPRPRLATGARSRDSGLRPGRRVAACRPPPDGPHPPHSATSDSTLRLCGSLASSSQQVRNYPGGAAHFPASAGATTPSTSGRKEMPPSKRGKVDGAAASADAGGDRISALPDDALHHVLSFLPAEDAVRTCVLARRWRYLWKSATGLRIGFSHGDTRPSVDSLRNFVNHLLLLRRGDSCLHTCELRLWFSSRWLKDEGINLNLWIRHVLEREVQMLRLEIHDAGYGFHLDWPVSQHLKTLSLIGVQLNSRCNFSNFPNLEHLEITDFEINQAHQISSKSLKHLSISDCYFDYDGLDTIICTPSLVSLRLDGHFAFVPLLDSMPSLKEAFARNRNHWGCQNEDCFSCVIYDDELNNVPLDESDYMNKSFLQGLSEAETLTLMCDYRGVVFLRDLEWCPTFNNLRTLLLNEWWCLDDDFYGLNVILKHSPVLEKLSLHLFSNGPQHKVEMTGRYNQMERTTTMLKHLKEIEVKCFKVNEQVHKVLKFLGTFGIHFLFK